MVHPSTDIRHAVIACARKDSSASSTRMGDKTSTYALYESEKNHFHIFATLPASPMPMPAAVVRATRIGFPGHSVGTFLHPLLVLVLSRVLFIATANVDAHTLGLTEAATHVSLVVLERTVGRSGLRPVPLPTPPPGKMHGCFIVFQLVEV